jgi:flagellar capping protein FliD
MASTISSSSYSASAAADIDAAIKKLAPTFQTAISATIDAESSPLKKAQAQRDAIDIRRGVYTDMKSNFDALRSSVQALITTQATYALNRTSVSTVTPFTSGYSVFSASASETAQSGEYDIAVTSLARAQTQATAASASADIALGKSGTFWLGGNGVAAVNSFVPSTSVTDAITGTVADGQRELGSTLEGEVYSLQVRDSAGIRQFRLANADGAAVSIRKMDGSGYTDGWQTMTDSAYDTGRGLVLTLSTTGSAGSTSIKYTAKGTSIAVNASDTQNMIANAINGAVQPEGHDFRASVVANTLVLSGAQTGGNHSLLYTDSAGLGFGDLQTARNASFSVNGMVVSRASNSSLTDVISGVTLNLNGDAEGKGAHLSLVASSDKPINSMNSLITNFNTALNHLTQKMAITAKTSGATTTYTRNALTNDTVFSSLRTEMYSRLGRSYANTGSFKTLAEIGLSMDKDFKLTFDKSKFGAAIQNHFADVAALLDSAMGQFDTVLAGYTGSSGTLQKSIESIDAQKTTYDRRIERYTDSQTMRKQSLFNSYLEMQNQLVEMNYQSNMLNLLMYGTTTTTGTTVNTTG